MNMEAQVSKSRSADIEKQVNLLLQKMTLEEKIGQLNQYSGAWAQTGPDRSERETDPKYKDVVKGRVGSFLNVAGAKETRALQKVAVEKSRLGVPLLFGLDVIHGYKTIFPVPIAEAASWDLEAIERSARIAATEAAATGIHWTFAPMVDIARDPRWGRIVEGAGEDTYLGCQIAAARVRGFQGKDLAATNTILACAKHFAAYGAVEAGREYNTVTLSRRILREVYLPPFKAAIDAGAATVMTAFNDVDGIPASGSAFLLRDILKGEWGFDGFVISDYNAFAEMILHGVAKDRSQAAELAIIAGSDMDMASDVFIDCLSDLVKSNRIKEELIDDAVRRILRLKFELGLFENPYRYCDEGREKKILLHPDHLEASRDMARKSIVLLKNEGDILPLKKDINTIAIIGPLAHSKRNMMGCWKADGDSSDVVTLLEGIRDKLSTDTKILYDKGCNVWRPTRPERITRAVQKASQADVIILAVGESANMTGERASRAYLDLPGEQKKLMQAIHQLGLPTVVVLMGGRPMTINWMSDNMPALLETWLLGTQAGNAIADVLFGDYNPSGKLPVSFPYAVGQIPVYYNHKNTGRPFTPETTEWGVSIYSDIPNEPLYPFGFGLSYIQFEYSDIRLNKQKIKMDENLEISVTVRNSGALAGEEVVQLYVRDMVGSVTRPVKELKGFQKIYLKEGESKEVRFTLRSADLAFYDKDMHFKAEPGDFKVFVGTNSRDVLETDFVLE